jgi:hypothetical protein
MAKDVANSNLLRKTVRLGKSANDRPVRPSQAANDGIVQVEATPNQIRRRESHPLIQWDILEFGTIEDVDQTDGHRADILNVMAQRTWNEADIAGVIVGG